MPINPSTAPIVNCAEQQRGDPAVSAAGAKPATQTQRITCAADHLARRRR